MPRRTEEWKFHKGGKLMSIGLVLVVIGAMMRYGYSAPDILLVVGGLFFIKGLLMKIYSKA